MPTFSTLPFELQSLLPDFPGPAGADASSLSQLLALVSGGGRSELRSLAISKLLETDLPDKGELLETILDDPKEPSDIRHLAALGLRRIGGEGVRQVLESHALSDDPLVRDGALKALAWVGDQNSRALLERATAKGAGDSPGIAEFASLIIAHRLELKGRRPAWPKSQSEGEAVQPPCPRPVRLLPAEPDEVDLCLRSIGPRPFGVDLSRHQAISLYCGQHVWMFAYNAAVLGSANFRALARRRRLVAIIAQKSLRLERYAPRFAVLLMPSSEGSARIGIFGQDGQPLCLGKIARSGDGWAFELAPAPGPKPYAVTAVGRIGKEFELACDVFAGAGEKRSVLPKPPKHRAAAEPLAGERPR